MAHSGSSPRVRGTDLLAAIKFSGGRFIPACAGNRSSAEAGLPGFSVHPRVCGEQLDGLQNAARILGSSPRVRGTVIGRLKNHGHSRFIPACAGNSI